MTRVEPEREGTGFPPPGAAVPGAPPGLVRHGSTPQARDVPAVAAGPTVDAPPQPAARWPLGFDLSEPRLLYAVSGALVVAAGLIQWWSHRHLASLATRAGRRRGAHR